MIEKQKKLPYSRAYDFLLKDKKMMPAEKLVLFEICRYWPNPCWFSNKTIAENLGFSERYVEMIIRRLEKKGYIKRGFAHTDKGKNHHTVRVIVPVCFSKKCSKIINWASAAPERLFGQQPNNHSGNNRTTVRKMPEQSFDLIDSKKKMKYKSKATPAPLPAVGQAPALPENKKRVSKSFGRFKRKTPVPTQREMEQKRQSQIKALLAAG